jgi:hypothetical protein
VQHSQARRYRDQIVGFRFLAAFGAVVAAIAPAVMATAQGAKLEGSVSAYWDVDPDYYFWAPFTAGAVLLFIDGLISLAAPSQRRYRNRWFNVVLGVALLLLTWFNKDDYPEVHYTSAVTFFALFIAVIGYTALLGWSGRHLGEDEEPGDERMERASAKVSGIFFCLLMLTFVAWALSLISFYFFEVFALLNFALFHIQGSVNPFPYHHYEFKIGWLNTLLRALRIMTPKPGSP